jgi:hypothetical protein
MFGLSNILSSGGSIENAGFSLNGGLKCIMYRDDAPLPVSELIVSLQLLILNGIVIVAFWYLYYAYMRRGETVRRRSNRRDAMIVSLLVLCYNSYPKFIRGFFQLFSCTRFPGESNTSRLIGSLDTKCYSSEHISWFLSIGLPVLLLIVIGFPMAGLMKLLMEYKRGTLNDPSILSTVGFLYDGKIPPAPMYNREMSLVIHIHTSALLHILSLNHTHRIPASFIFLGHDHLPS